MTAHASQPMDEGLGPSYNSPPQPCPSYDVDQFCYASGPGLPGSSRAPGAGTAQDWPFRSKSHAIAVDKHQDVDPAVGEKSAIVPGYPRAVERKPLGSIRRDGEKELRRDGWYISAVIS